MELVLREGLDAKRRIVRAPTGFDGEFDQGPDFLEEVICRAGRTGFERHDLLHVFAPHLGDPPVAVLAQKPLDHKTIGVPRSRSKAKEIGAGKILQCEPIEGADRSGRSSPAWCGCFAIKRRPIGRNEFIRAGQPWKRNPRPTRTPKIVAPVPMPIDEPIDVTKTDRGHVLRKWSQVDARVSSFSLGSASKARSRE